MANVGLWVGIAGIIVSVFAVIILYLTRKNILDILDKDVILFDRNFEIKKSVLERAFNLVDRLEADPTLIADANFKLDAKNCYNSLLCVVSDLKVARAFYSIAIKGDATFSNIGFKLMCRADIGLANKRSKKIKSQNNEGNLRAGNFVKPVSKPNENLGQDYPTSPIVEQIKVSPAPTIETAPTKQPEEVVKVEVPPVVEIKEPVKEQPAKKSVGRPRKTK